MSVLLIRILFNITVIVLYIYIYIYIVIYPIYIIILNVVMPFGVFLLILFLCYFDLLEFITFSMFLLPTFIYLIKWYHHCNQQIYVLRIYKYSCMHMHFTYYQFHHSFFLYLNEKNNTNNPTESIIICHNNFYLCCRAVTLF